MVRLAGIRRGAQGAADRAGSALDFRRGCAAGLRSQGGQSDHVSAVARRAKAEACPPIAAKVSEDGGHGAMRLCPPYVFTIPPARSCRAICPTPAAHARA